MKCRAQATIELLLLLGISLIALAIIYSLYLQQVELSGASREAVTTKNTLDNLVNAANRLYISGPGSKTRVFVDLPNSLDMSESSIVASSLSLQLSSGTDLVTTADVNFFGDWKKANGEYLTGGYFATLVFDGNVVRIYYDDYDLSSEVIFVAAKQGASVTKTFSIRNNSQNNAHFWINNYFSHSPNVSLTIDNSDFVLTPNETKLITLDFVLSQGSSGNYSGYLTVIGQINDGASDLNNSKQVLLSVESFTEIKEVMINPNSTSFSGLTGSSYTKSFSICNSGYYDLSSLSWVKGGDASSWFSLPSSITSLSKGTCTDFNLIITIPLSASLGVNDANFTVLFNDGNFFTSYIYVTALASNVYSVFFSGTDNNLTHWFDYNGFVKKRTDNNSWTATGELDWNSSLIVSSSAGDLPISSSSSFWDANLVAAYHLNGNGLDSKNSNNLTLSNAPTSITGLWDTQGYYLDGINQTLYKNSAVSWDITSNPTNSVSYGGWIKPSVCGSLAGFSLSASQGQLRLASYNGYWIFQLVAGQSYAAGGICVVGEWQHIFGTYDKDTNRITVYQNGIKAGTAVLAAAANYSGAYNDGIWIGNSQNYFNGSFEEVLVFDKTLTESQVNALYVSQKANFPDSNLAAYLKFDYFTSTATIDSAQNRAVGLYNSPTVVSGFWDSNALFFDGTNDHLAVNADQNLKYTGGDMTISLWIKQFDDADGGYFVSKPWNSSGVYNYYLLSSSAGIITAGVTGATSGAFATTSAMPLGVWNHLVTVFGSDKSVNIYVNGVLFKSGSHGITSWVPSGGDTNINLAIGCIYPYGTWAGSTSLCLKSQIDELKIYKKAFTAAEVLADYNSFLSAKFVDANIIDAGRSVDWNQFIVNKDTNYLFSQEIKSGEKWVDSNLIGLWHFNSNLNDSSQSAFNLTNSGVDYTSGLWSTNAANFDGADYSYVADTTLLDNNINSFTWNFWAKHTTTTLQRVLSKFYYTGDNSGYGAFLNWPSAGNFTFCIYSNTSNCNNSVSTTGFGKVNDGLWHMNTAVIDRTANILYIYIDGVLAGSGSITGIGGLDTSDDLYIGKHRTLGNNYTGLMEELSLWNRALTATEVKDLYRKGVSKLDLNLYSCSDLLCANKTSSIYVSDVNNGLWTQLSSSLLNSRYLGVDAIFGKSSAFNDYNAGAFWIGSFVSDVNVIYLG